jgi:hypothetical protein
MAATGSDRRRCRRTGSEAGGCRKQRKEKEKKVGPTVWRGHGGPREMEVEMGNLEEYAE